MTANRAESGQLQFWSKTSKIFNLRSSKVKYPRDCSIHNTLIPNLVKLLTHIHCAMHFLILSKETSKAQSNSSSSWFSFNSSKLKLCINNKFWFRIILYSNIYQKSIFFSSNEDQNRYKQFPPFILDCIKWHVLTCNSYSQVRNSCVLITRQGHFSLLMNSYLGYWIPHKEEVVDPNKIIGPSNSLTLFKIPRRNFVKDTLHTTVFFKFPKYVLTFLVFKFCLWFKIYH